MIFLFPEMLYSFLERINCDQKTQKKGVAENNTDIRTPSSALPKKDINGPLSTSVHVVFPPSFLQLLFGYTGGHFSITKAATTTCWNPGHSPSNKTYPSKEGHVMAMLHWMLEYHYAISN